MTLNARQFLLGLCTCLAVCSVMGELLINGNFESTTDTNWHCWNFQCTLIAPGDSRFGTKSMKVSGRGHSYEGPSQSITILPGHYYRVQAYVKLLNDNSASIGQTMMIEISISFTDGTTQYTAAAERALVRSSDGWILLQGDFLAPNKEIRSSSFYFQGPAPGIEFVVDQASATEIAVDNSWRSHSDSVINNIRKSDINFRLTTAAGIDKSQVQIVVQQTKKSFPFGTAINSWMYVDASKQKYRDFIHQHFNWAVLENALKWEQLEPTQGHYNGVDRVLQTINGLRSHGLKVRGHNMVWSIDEYVPDWVKAQSGNQLRATVQKHINEVCNLTRGLLEHWDVNNENLHGFWFQNQLHDYNYDLELFREMYNADHNIKLFLNDYNVVGGGGSTGAYLEQAKRFKAANVHLYGLGVQSHFGGNDPNPSVVKMRLDTLAQAGVPIWATELDVISDNENQRADMYEHALRALYGHPAVEGILFWGFWDQAHYAGIRAALVRGDNLDLTAAGRRVLDLFENQWMTHETHVLSQAGDQFTVRGFHGDYEIRVRYQGHDLTALTQRFTLDKTAHTVTLNIHQ